MYVYYTHMPAFNHKSSMIVLLIPSTLVSRRGISRPNSRVSKIKVLLSGVEGIRTDAISLAARPTCPVTII